jgi:hypothetical protein
LSDDPESQYEYNCDNGLELATRLDMVLLRKASVHDPICIACNLSFLLKIVGIWLVYEALGYSRNSSDDELH